MSVSKIVRHLKYVHRHDQHAFQIAPPRLSYYDTQTSSCSDFAVPQHSIKSGTFLNGVRFTSLKFPPSCTAVDLQVLAFLTSTKRTTASDHGYCVLQQSCKKDLSTTYAPSGEIRIRLDRSCMKSCPDPACLVQILSAFTDSDAHAETWTFHASLSTNVTITESSRISCWKNIPLLTELAWPFPFVGAACDDVVSEWLCSNWKLSVALSDLRPLVCFLSWVKELAWLGTLWLPEKLAV